MGAHGAGGRRSLLRPRGTLPSGLLRNRACYARSVGFVCRTDAKFGEKIMAESDRTIRLHRVLKAPPERVYRAFTDPDALVKWMAPHGFTARVHDIDVRVGGGYRMSFTNFSAGGSHSFGGRYRKVVPNELLEYSDKFDDPNLPGEMSMKVTFQPVMGGCELRIEQSNLPAMIPLEMCYLGWQESLMLLAKLVEADIPAGA